MIWFIVYALFLACFVWAWKKFHDTMNARETKSDEDYVTGDDETDWGDKS